MLDLVSRVAMTVVMVGILGAALFFLVDGLFPTAKVDLRPSVDVSCTVIKTVCGNAFVPMFSDGGVDLTYGGRIK
jgi:hypothetical protein